jgi:CCR4-NOT transcriptional regulation complex NOT5 subunit
MQDELMTCDERRQEAHTPRDEEMYDESDEDLLHPFDRRSSLIGLTNYPTRVPSSQSPLAPQGDSNSKTIERLESESAELRRQASDAVQLSIRLSDQLAQAHAEASRAKSALRSAETLLEEESTRRVEAEKIADDEMKLRRGVEEALSLLEKRWTANP